MTKTHSHIREMCGLAVVSQRTPDAFTLTLQFTPCQCHSLSGIEYLVWRLLGGLNSRLKYDSGVIILMDVGPCP